MTGKGEPKRVETSETCSIGRMFKIKWTGKIKGVGGGEDLYGKIFKKE